MNERTLPGHRRGLRELIFTGYSCMLSVLAIASPSMAQVTPPAPVVTTRANPAIDPAAASEDVVVEGSREPESDQLATRDTLNSMRVGGNPVWSRLNYDASDRFALCAIKRHMGSFCLLRLALDSPMNSVRQDNAQRRFVQTYASCAADSGLAGSSIGQVVDTGNAGSSARELQFYNDRGALFVRAIQVFAPNLTLSTSDMEDAAVQARFVTREQPLARLRLPMDRQFLGAAVCLVHSQPALSIRLVTRDMPQALRQTMAATIVNRSKSCFGNVKKVYFDAVQMRFYLADALYRWIVAIRGTDSLVPDGAK